MSVVDQLKNLFSKKPAESSSMATGSSVTLSLGMPATVDPRSGRHVQEPDSATEDDTVVPMDGVQPQELVSIPLLGRRSIVTHQRILFILLALALGVLGSVAIFSVRQADMVAQQVAGTGQSLKIGRAHV